MNQEIELLHCAKCDAYKNPNEFYKHKGRPGERAAYCKECEKATPTRKPTGKGQAKGQKEPIGSTGPRKSRRIELLPEGTLRCSKCRHIKPTTAFHKNKAVRRGFSNECKLCRSPNGRKGKTRKKDALGNLWCRGPCQSFRPPEDFYTTRYTKDGIQARCKACCLGHEPKPKRFKSDTEAQCSKCKIIKPLSFFGSDKTRCKDCERERNRELKAEKRAANPRPLRVPRTRYGTYRRHAKERGLDFLITVEQFNALTILACTYCGSTGKGGVDRIDSEQGYLQSNCAPCCSTCNFVKRAMSVEELRAHLTKMVKHMGIIL